MQPPPVPAYNPTPMTTFPKPELVRSSSSESKHANALGAAGTRSSSTDASQYGLKKTSTFLAKHRARLGLTPEAPVHEEHDLAHHSDNFWPKVRITLKEPFAEFWGTFTLVLFGCGSIAQTTLSKGNPSAPGGAGFGDYQSIAWGYGLGLMLGIYVAGDSGAYLNPAVTVVNCILRKLPLQRLPLYILAQISGAFCAAAVVYGNYVGLINAYEGGPNVRTVAPSETATAGIFATYPSPAISRTSQFFSEFLASAILMFVIFALKDDTNKGQFSASGSWFPLCLFFLMFGIAIAFGAETGFAINLARDLGPRLLTWAVGYGNNVWSAAGYYFWIPMVSPFCGCLVGGVVYDMFIYTGETPINDRYLGLGHLWGSGRREPEDVLPTTESGSEFGKREGNMV